MQTVKNGNSFKALSTNYSRNAYCDFFFAIMTVYPEVRFAALKQLAKEPVFLFKDEVFKALSKHAESTQLSLVNAFMSNVDCSSNVGMKFAAFESELRTQQGLLSFLTATAPENLDERASVDQFMDLVKALKIVPNPDAFLV